MKYTQIKNEIILASKSKVRKEILEKNNIKCKVIISNIDEDPIKKSLLNEGASPEIISKNLAEIKALKVSQTKENELDNSKKTFQKYQWPIIDVTRKSVEETAASVIKIYEIYSNKK